MSSKIILGYPYSGALYGYIADQMQHEYSHTQSIGVHPYYTTLYGRNYKKYIDAALMFTLIYDSVYLTPADNPWPPSKKGDTSDVHHELGLYACWNNYGNLFNDTDGIVDFYLSDSEIARILGGVFKVPASKRKMVMSSIIYEYCLSREHRCPIICSPARKLILDRLVDIDMPATHPRSLQKERIRVVDDYLDLTGLLLSPKNLDDLISIKPEKNVRSYASSFLSMMESYEINPSVDTKLNVVSLARDAIDREHIGERLSGLLTWVSKVFRYSGHGATGILTRLGASLTDKFVVDNAKWYGFSGEILKAESRAIIRRKIDSVEEGLRSSRE